MNNKTALIIDEISDDVEYILRFLNDQGLLNTDFYLVLISKTNGLNISNKILSKWNVNYFHIGYPDAFDSVSRMDDNSLSNYATSITNILFINHIITHKNNKVFLQNYALHFLIPGLNKKAKFEIYVFLNYVPEDAAMIGMAKRIFNGVNKIICANDFIRMHLLEKFFSIPSEKLSTFNSTLLNDRTRKSFRSIINDHYFAGERKRIILMDISKTEIRYVFTLFRSLLHLKRKGTAFNVILTGTTDVPFLKEEFLPILSDVLVLNEISDPALFYLYNVCDLLMMLQHSNFFSFRFLRILSSSIKVVTFRGYSVIPCSHERQLELPQGASRDEKILSRSLSRLLMRL